jgi:Dipeptidyl peptidase IV (DPP IV) N-terminal region.
MTIAYLRIDERPVPEFTVVDHIPYDQKLEVTPYPKAGDPNPIVKLGVVNTSGGETRWVNTFKYTPEDFLITRVTWSPDSKSVVYQAQNREQTFLDLNFADRSTGESRTAIHETRRRG